MAKLFRKNRIIYGLVILFLCIFSSLFLVNGNDVDLSGILTSSNFITLIINNIYIYFIYSRCKNVKCIYDKIITRIGQSKFINSYVLNFLLDIVVFFILVALPHYLKFGLYSEYLYLFLITVLIYFITFIIFEVISMFIFILPKANYLIVIPVLLNVIIHYFVIAEICSRYFLGG